MDNLINSHQDVAHLHYQGIIEHWLGSDAEVADLFNHLCQEVVFDINDSYLFHLSENVNRYYDHKWNAWCASLRHNYFSNPWAIISLVAAAFLLLITFTQPMEYMAITGQAESSISKLASSLSLSLVEFQLQSLYETQILPFLSGGGLSLQHFHNKS